MENYQAELKIDSLWREPLVGFANAKSPYIQNLKSIITASHVLPQDIMPDATIVIACFVPFSRELAATNIVDEPLASPEWAEAYEITNKMLGKLNQYLISELKRKGYHGAVSPEAFTFDQKILKSNWSHRHFAYAAGMGTFGINNMLITKSGGCGRYTTIVTNLDITPDKPSKEEYCLYKKNGTCGVCVKNCPSGALTLQGYDRNKCYKVLQENARHYSQFGSSYVNKEGIANSVGSEVCGKCAVYTPCAFYNNS